MKKEFLAGAISPEMKLILAAAGLVFAAIFLFDWNSNLLVSLDNKRAELEMDRALSKDRPAHEKIYREILAQRVSPQGERLKQNEWIRVTQDLAGQYGLQLQEITPVSEGGKGPQLSVVLEGSAENGAGFLQALAASGNPVYAESMNLSRAEDDQKTLRIEMVLAQF